MDFDLTKWLTNLTGEYPEVWYVIGGLVIFGLVRKALVKFMKRRWPKKVDRPAGLVFFLDVTDPVMKLLDWAWGKLPGQDKPDIFEEDDPSSTGIKAPRP